MDPSPSTDSSMHPLLQGLAFHEAGHAVVGYHLGKTVIRVLIDAADYNGRTDFEPTKFDAEREALVSLAGWAAQSRFDVETIQNPEGTRAGTLFSDMVKLSEILEALVPDNGIEQNRLRLEFSERAKTLVAEPNLWQAIERIAGELAKRHVLDGGKVEALIRSAVAQNSSEPEQQRQCM